MGIRRLGAFLASWDVRCPRGRLRRRGISTDLQVHLQRLLSGPGQGIGRIQTQFRTHATATGTPRLRLVEHPDSTEGRNRDREREAARHQDQQAGQGQGQGQGENQYVDTSVGPGPQSPLERFRRPPNKAFSVTDLISPAWCELQYWYTLTKFGRKRRTPAMKKGITIHKTFEDEIYTTVAVEITTKEDALALRLWNVIQGLRTLREYGLTRELEVWGVVDGQLVNGVIDELSYECPDPELEDSAAEHYADVEASRAVLPEYQMSLTDYLLSPSQGGRRLSDMNLREEEEPEQGDQKSVV